MSGVIKSSCLSDCYSMDGARRILINSINDLQQLLERFEEDNCDIPDEIKEAFDDVARNASSLCNVGIESEPKFNIICDQIYVRKFNV